MKKFKFPLIALLVAGLFTIAFIGCKKEVLNPELTSNAKTVAKINLGQPTLTCAGSTTVGIDLTFTAGTNGAPSGFSIQWMTKAEFDAQGWPGVSEEVGTRTTFCKASFSGNANASRYNLTAGEQVTVTVGDFLFDNGASTNCPQELDPCTAYVFRAFSHADNLTNKSVFSSNQECSTLCNTSCGKHGVGYWKHNCPNAGAGLTLGTVSYTDEEICTILNKPSMGNGLIILAHQLIAAKLNGIDTSVADAAVGAQNILTDSQPAKWQAGLIASLRKGNEICGD